MSAGEPVPSLRGKVTNVFKRFTGTNDHGDWSIQTIVVRDETGEAKLKIVDRDEIPKTWQGHEVHAFCKAGDKGLTGLKIEDDEYRNKVTKIVKVTPSATLDLAEVTAQPTPTADLNDDQIPGAEVPPQPAAPPAAPAAPAAPAKPSNGVTYDAEKDIAHWARLYLRCMDAADWVQTKRTEAVKPPMTPDHYQACVSSLFIQATRNGH